MSILHKVIFHIIITTNTDICASSRLSDDDISVEYSMVVSKNVDDGNICQMYCEKGGMTVTPRVFFSSITRQLRYSTAQLGCPCPIITSDAMELITGYSDFEEYLHANMVI